MQQMTRIRMMAAAVAGLALAACDAPQSGVVAEDLSGAALEARLTDQRITIWEGGLPQRATIDLRPGGTGIATLERPEPIMWEVQGVQLCIAEAGDTPECARTAINGDRITVRWSSARGGQRQLSGVLSPL